MIVSTSSSQLERKKDLDPKNMNRTGVLTTNTKASLLDLIRGEEVANKDKIGLTRLQNLLFTFILVGTYMSSLSAMFAKLVTKTPEIQNVADNFPINRFQELGSSALALLFIRHAGYLTGKSIDKQPSTESGTP